MANVTIPSLPVSIGLTGAEDVIIDQIGTTKRTTTGEIAKLAASGVIIPAAFPTVAFAEAYPIPLPLGAVFLIEGEATIGDGLGGWYEVFATDPGGGIPLAGNQYGGRITITNASETVAGEAKIATQIEVDAGTDDTTIVTPKKIANSANLVPQFQTVTAAAASTYPFQDGQTFATGGYSAAGD